MKLFNVTVWNGQDYEDERWLEWLLVANTPEEAVEKAWNKTQENKDSCCYEYRKENIYADEITQTDDGYEIKIENKLP